MRRRSGRLRVQHACHRGPTRCSRDSGRPSLPLLLRGPTARGPSSATCSSTQPAPRSTGRSSITSTMVPNSSRHGGPAFQGRPIATTDAFRFLRDHRLMTGTDPPPRPTPGDPIEVYLTDDFRDPVTGLLRAWYLDEKSEIIGSVFRPERAAPWLASLPADTVFFGFDLRHFRAVNLQHGHVFGDSFLAEVGRRLGLTASPWPAFRFGGDEFLVAARLSREQDILDFAASLRAEIERPFEGVAIETWAAAARASAGQTPEQLFRALDRALVAVQQSRWPELLVAPPGADGTTWFERPVS
jgi:diguanylate cyclase (GGDEF)-like protein